MCLFLDDGLWIFGGGTAVHAREREARVIRAGRIVDSFAVEARVEWIKIAPDARTALLYTDDGDRVWRWREGLGVERFLASPKDRCGQGCGFLSMGGSELILVNQTGMLRAIDGEGRTLFSSNLSSPRAFSPRYFTRVSSALLTMTGGFVGEIFDAAVTVDIDALANDPDAVQDAIRSRRPLHDQAIKLAVGAYESGAAIVFRDPEDTEQTLEEFRQDGDDAERHDVEDFAGLYLRDLDSGVLIERHPYAGRAGSGSALAATARSIVIQVVGGVDRIARDTGAVRHHPGVILDVAGQQLATVAGGEVVAVAAIDD